MYWCMKNCDGDAAKLQENILNIVQHYRVSIGKQFYQLGYCRSLFCWVSIIWWVIYVANQSPDCMILSSGYSLDCMMIRVIKSCRVFIPNVTKALLVVSLDMWATRRWLLTLRRLQLMKEGWNPQRSTEMLHHLVG